MNAHHRYLQRVANDIDHHGMAAVERDLTTIVDRARRSGANPVAVSVLVDRSAPEIARARAFGMVAADLARAAGTTDLPIAHEARPLAMA